MLKANLEGPKIALLSQCNVSEILDRPRDETEADCTVEALRLDHPTLGPNSPRPLRCLRPAAA